MSTVDTCFVLFLLTFANQYADTARILGVFPTPSHSHHAVFQPIIRELALRGHQLTIITPNPMNDPSLKNLREIDVGKVSYDIWQQHSIATLGNEKRFQSNDLSSFIKVVDIVIEAQMKTKGVQDLIADPSEKFDLLLVEFLYPTSYAFKHHFNCPMVGISSMPLLLGGYDSVGNPTHPALYPDYNLPYSNTLTFFQRVHSFIFSVGFRLYGITKVDKINTLMKQFFGENMRSVKDLSKEVSIVLTNVNPVLSPPRPNVPAHIEISGVHIKPPKELPSDLKSYLDNSKRGVIYVSFGTNVKSSLLPPEKLQILLNVFRELPYDIIWKFEADELPNKPKNVKIMKWLPQQDLLRHPNVILFVFQGGLQSLEEAIFSDMPVVVMPFFFDQHANSKKIAESGVGITLPFLELSKDDLKSTILEVVKNDKYRDKMKAMHRIAIDQPMTGLEKSIWWIEYVLRHDGASHLKSPTVDIPLYQYFLLDVMSFVGVCLWLTGYILWKLSVLLLRVRYLL